MLRNLTFIPAEFILCFNRCETLKPSGQKECVVSLRPNRVSSVSPAFGRRVPPSASPLIEPSRLPKRVSTARETHPGGQPLTAHYNWKIGVVGASSLVFAVKAFHAVLINLSEQHTDQQFVFNLSIAGIISALIGIGWLGAYLQQSPALTINERGVEGFTLLGTKFIAWEDVGGVEISRHNFYKEQVVIHAILGSKTGTWFGVLTIPVKIAAIDQPLETVLDAIRSYRPQVNIVGAHSPPGATFFLKFR